MNRRDLIFVSYSHKDDKWLKDLQEHLKPLEREGLVAHWSDTLIKTGAYWRKEIENAIARAKVAVLLVSKHFLASDFIAESELPLLFKAAEEDGATIMPVILSPCRFGRTKELSSYHAVNSPDRTLAEMEEAERDRIWLKLTETIEDLLIKIDDADSAELPDARAGQTASAGNGSFSVLKLDISSTSEVDSPFSSKNEDSIPDVVILIQAREESSHRSLTYQLKTRNRDLGISDRVFGPVSLKVDPQRYFDEFFADIESLSHSDDNERQVMERQLEAKGSFLFVHLFPRELQNILRSMVGRVHTVQIQSNEGWIPWELVRIIYDGSSDGDMYLCEAFALARWIDGQSHVSNLALTSIALIMMPEKELGLTAYAATRDNLLALQIDGRTVKQIAPRYIDVQEALASGKYDAFHFEAHGNFDPAAPDSSVLLLGAESLKPEDISASMRELKTRRPLIFMNACQSGRSANSLTEIGGWAAQFLRAGAGAFVGSHWALKEQSAVNFSRSFYKHFIDGLSIGEAVRRARLEIRQTGDPTWLAYTVYSNPLAKIGRRLLNNTP